MPLRRATVPLAAALGALVLGGCGDRDAIDRVARDGAVRVTLREYRIDPQDWEVPAGRVRLVVTNAGRLTHNLAIESVTKESDEQPHEYARTPTVPPGGTARATARLKPGTYRIACTLANHDRLGQFGTLKVLPR
jgi:uncharacterized cupredoxin-like copper-binding protein